MRSKLVRPRVAALSVLALMMLAGCSQALPQGTMESAARSGGPGLCAPTNSLSAQDIGTSTTPYLEDLLTRIPGVAVRLTRDGYSIRIRGTNGFAGNGEPLYLIDGMPFVGQPGTTIPVNVKDIECVEVLKDAGHTSIFGSRGTNGVILITTRRS